MVAVLFGETARVVVTGFLSLLGLLLDVLAGVVDLEVAFAMVVVAVVVVVDALIDIVVVD